MAEVVVAVVVVVGTAVDVLVVTVGPTDAVVVAVTLGPTVAVVVMFGPTIVVLVTVGPMEVDELVVEDVVVVAVGEDGELTRSMLMQPVGTVPRKNRCTLRMAELNWPLICPV
jgi:hypothetical protein